MKGPERLDALVAGLGLIGEQGSNTGLCGLAFDEEAERVHANVLRGVSECGGDGCVVRFGEFGDCVSFSFAVHDAPDAGKVMVTVGADRGIDAVVVGAASVVVDGGLVVKINDIECAIWSHAHLDGTEPQVFRGDELGFLATGFFGGGVAESVGREEGVVDDVDGGFGDKVAVVPLCGPCASVIDGGPGGGGEGADPIDLAVGFLVPRHLGEGFWRGDDDVCSGFSEGAFV